MAHLVESDVKLWVTSNTTQVVFVHAGVVAWNGRGLILPGRSHAGKTTLVSALISQGALYYSDDYAVLDHAGRVWPFPQSLAVRRGSDARVFTPPEQFGGRTGRGGIEVGWVIETRYEYGSRFDPISMSPGETALALLDNAPAARVHSASVLSTVGRAAATARGMRGPRGDAREEAERMLGMLLATSGSS